MNYMPKMNRRTFVASAAAAGGGLALGLDIPAAARRSSAPPTARPKSTPGWWSSPDDTVVIRIARSEMGQGTLTGLAQLVAEELECDWSKVTTEYPDARPEPRAQARLGRHARPAAAAASATSHQYVREGGAAAREMLKQAAANEWKVPVAEVHRRQERHHPQGVEPHHDLRQGRGSRRQARAAEGRQAQGPEGLDDRRQAAQAARHPATRSPASMTYGSDLKMPGHAERRHQGLPGVRRQAQELRRRQGPGMPGVKKVVQVGEAGVAVIADTFWQRQDRDRRAADRLGRRPERQGVERHDRRVAQGRARRPDLRRQQERRRQGRDRRGGEEGRGGLQLSVPEPRHHGADERHRALYARQVRGVGPTRRTAKRRSAPPWKHRACRPPSATSTSCIWAAASAGAARQNTSRRWCRSPSRCRARRSS